VAARACALHVLAGAASDADAAVVLDLGDVADLRLARLFQAEAGVEGEQRHPKRAVLDDLAARLLAPVLVGAAGPHRGG